MLTAAKQPNKTQLLQWVYSQPNPTVRFIGNVIHCHMGNKVVKLRGLKRLADEDRVGTGNNLDQVSIDGAIGPISRLEEFA